MLQSWPCRRPLGVGGNAAPLACKSGRMIRVAQTGLGKRSAIPLILLGAWFGDGRLALLSFGMLLPAFPQFFLGMWKQEVSQWG